MTEKPKTGTAVAEIKPAERLKGQLAKMEGELAKCLPANILSAKFVRTVQTAINLNPDLGICTPDSVLGACMKAATDGLILDGREAALVVYNVKTSKPQEKPEVWEKRAQYMPMIAGIIKRCRNSGELSTLNAHVVYENDFFDYTLGDDERIAHKPLLTGKRGNAILVYAIAKLKDGALMREVMTVDEVDKIMRSSKTVDSNGKPYAGSPWAKWWGEMARKSAMRRLSKRLPMSADVASLFEADNDMYDMGREVTEHMDQEGLSPAPPTPGQKKSGGAAEKLKQAQKDAAETPHDAATGEIIEGDFKAVDPNEPPPADESDFGDPRDGDPI